MPDYSTQPPRSPMLRRYWKPVVATGAGGTAAAIWFEEILIYSEEILALIFLPIMAGVIYLFNIFVFKSRMPRREDLDQAKEKGEKKVPPC